MSEQFKTYRDFASASLLDIYGDRLDKALKLSANHLMSGVWLNESSSSDGIKFCWQELPWEVQLAPVNAIVSADFNNDGKNELILAQNHSTNWLETGPWRGGLGCHLEWDGEKFVLLSSNESGVILPNDTKSLLLFDFNGDGLQDLMAGQNDKEVLQFLNMAAPAAP